MLFTGVASHQANQPESGFTIYELMVVLVISGNPQCSSHTKPALRMR